MSTYYYLACDKHKAASDVIGGRSFPDRWWSNDEGELEAFLGAHADCEPRSQLISEHDERSEAYERVSAAVREPS